LPGAGGSIASLVSYSEARRTSSRKEYFGQGEPDGVIATESANNATVGGGFIPTFVLGIPGTPPDAVILGALLVQGFRTGPEMFTTHANVTYTFIGGLFIATLVMLPLGLLIGRYAFKSIVAIPKALLVPSIAFMTVIGTYAIRNNPFDVVVMVVLGVIGWVLARYDIKPSPIVLGLILGPIAEQGFVQGYLMGNASGSVLMVFFGRPISLAIIILVVISALFPLWRMRSSRRAKPSQKREVQHEH
jgi:putative tricarboxylic transport membrane protein